MNMFYCKTEALLSDTKLRKQIVFFLDFMTVLGNSQPIITKVVFIINFSDFSGNPES